MVIKFLHRLITTFIFFYPVYILFEIPKPKTWRPSCHGRFSYTRIAPRHSGYSRKPQTEVHRRRGSGSSIVAAPKPHRFITKKALHSSRHRRHQTEDLAPRQARKPPPEACQTPQLGRRRRRPQRVARRRSRRDVAGEQPLHVLGNEFSTLAMVWI